MNSSLKPPSGVISEAFCELYQNLHLKAFHLVKSSNTLTPPPLVSNALYYCNVIAFGTIIEQLESLSQVLIGDEDVPLYKAKLHLVYFNFHKDPDIIQNAIDLLEDLGAGLKCQTLLASATFAKGMNGMLDLKSACSLLLNLRRILTPHIVATDSSRPSSWAMAQFFKYFSAIVILHPKILEHEKIQSTKYFRAALYCQETVSRKLSNHSHEHSDWMLSLRFLQRFPG
jgi:hypothetical protein